MKYSIVDRGGRFPESGESHAYLRIDYWNDYSFVTMFEVVLFDERGQRFDLGSVKIGFIGQTTTTSTYSTLAASFSALPEKYFSLGQDVAYYSTLGTDISEQTRAAYLRGLRDIVADDSIVKSIEEEAVFRTSLLRSTSFTAIAGQFRRVLLGGAQLTDFKFAFFRPQTEKVAGIELLFSVEAASRPSSNIHALIGRNGAGKTVLLNEMISAIVKPEQTQSKFFADSFVQRPIPSDYFSSLISVSFSAFDPFIPPPDNADPELGTRYTYVGLKDSQVEQDHRLKSLTKLREECVSSIKFCLSDSQRKARWGKAIQALESDKNFASMSLLNLLTLEGKELSQLAPKLVEPMSSGHAVVLLTISSLISRVEEKSLVLLDEPESHLHPPLLSAFVRALAELLHDRNGVAVVATHSPVVLQEVPKSCVHVITRSGASMRAERPLVETFGENVGVLTHEVFGLEASQSGFHVLLNSAVSQGGSYEEILDSYGERLGYEGRGILRAMIAERDGSGRQI